MVASQLVLVNHFFLALMHNTADPATIPDLNNVMVGAECSLGCRQCSPVNGCLACEAPFFLVLERDGPRQTASCTKSCPKGFYKVKKKRNGFCTKCTMVGCVECLGPQYCSTCHSHYINFFGKCIRQTPDENTKEDVGNGTSSTLLPKTTSTTAATTSTTITIVSTPATTRLQTTTTPSYPVVTISSPLPSTTTVPSQTSTTTQESVGDVSVRTTQSTTPPTSPSTEIPITTSTRPPKRDKYRPCRRKERRKGDKSTASSRRGQERRKNRRRERGPGVRRDCRKRRRRRRKKKKERRRRKGKRRRKLKHGSGGSGGDAGPRTTSEPSTVANHNLTTQTGVLKNLTEPQPTTTTQEMIDLSLLGEAEGRGTGNTSLSHLDGRKFFYNNRPRALARYKQSRAYRRPKPAYVRGKKVRHGRKRFYTPG